MSAAPPPREYDQILSGDIKITKVKSHESTHKITFSKKNISKVLMYQVWSDTSVDLNNDRIVKEVKATSWVKSAFRKVEMVTVPSNSNCICTKEYNPVICPNGKKYSNGCEAGCANQQNCKPFSDIPFTPTTVMELDDGECPYHHKAKNCNEKDECRHVFVIKRALVNKCGQVVFYVSSEDIVLPSNPNQEVKRLKTIPTGSFCRARFDIDSLAAEGAPAAIPSWVPVPLAGAVPPPAGAVPPPATNYEIEFEMPPFVLPNGGGTIVVYGLNTIVNSQKCVEVYIGKDGVDPTPLGHFYNSLNSVQGKYDYAASVAQCVTLPNVAATPGNFQNSYLFCGNFNFFHYENQSPPVADVETHLIAQLSFSNTGVPDMNQLYSGVSGMKLFGLGLTQTAPQISSTSQVNRIIVSADNAVLFFGCFNAIQTSSGDMTTGNPEVVTRVEGYASMIEYVIFDGQFIRPFLQLIEGYGVYFSNYPAQPAAVGIITDAVLIVQQSKTLTLIVGQWEKLAIDGDTQYTPPAGGSQGFAVHDSTYSSLSRNKWSSTPVVPAPTANEVFINAYCIRPALSFPAGYFIFTGIEKNTTTGNDNPRVYVYNSATNVVQQATGDALTLVAQTDFTGFYNGITGLTIDIGAGATPHDFILIISQPTNSIKVLYMEGGSINTTFLTPNPTGLVPQIYNQKAATANYYMSPEFSAFGIASTFGVPPPPNAALVIGAEKSKEQWNGRKAAV